MGLLYKILLAVAGLALLLLVALSCSWFLYTRDLPDFDHLSQFAPKTQSVVSDACLASPSTSVPLELMGKPIKNALAAAEPTRLLSDQIARSLMCNHSGGMGKYHLNAFRLSWHIQRHFSEQQIFTIYANRAYFGVGMVGVERASQELFRKEPAALSIEEAALIAGLLRAPAYFSPYKHPEQALQRRNKVLEEMVAQGTLGAGEAAKLAAAPVITQPQGNTDQPSVEIVGLRHDYAACAVVQFSVRNRSQREIYVEVYAEEFKSNAWTYVDYPYDLKDPRSLYVKRVMVNPDMMHTNTSVDVEYNRCLEPTFVKEMNSAFIAAIKKKDKAAASRVLQRLRVDVYNLDQGHIKRVQQVWSTSFQRVPEK